MPDRDEQVYKMVTKMSYEKLNLIAHKLKIHSVDDLVELLTTDVKGN